MTAQERHHQRIVDAVMLAHLDGVSEETFLRLVQEGVDAARRIMERRAAVWDGYSRLGDRPMAA